MIDSREWTQLLTALGHSVVGNLNGAPILKLLPTLDVLRTHAAPGCGYRIGANGQFHIDTETPAQPAPEAPTPEAVPEETP